MPQDFKNKSLQGYSFKGENLTGADFSHSDIRGADFTDANLAGANFSYAKAGLQLHSRISLVLISLLLSVFSSFASVLAVTFAAYTLFPYSISPDKVLATLLVLTLFFFFFRVALQEGLVSAVVSVSICGVVLGAIIGLVAGGLAGIAAGVVSVTITTAIIALMLVVTTLIITMAHTVAGRMAGGAAIALILSGGMIGAIAGITTGKEVIKVLNENGTVPALREAAAVDAIFAAWTGTLAGVLIAAYICWRTLKGNHQLAWIKNIAINFATTGSTSFHGADLTDVDFSYAILEHTDLRAQNTTRTLWYQCRKLDSARLENTLLAESKTRHLLVSSYCRSLPQPIESKLVILKLEKANLRSGSTATLQIGTEGTHPTVQCTGELPPALEISRCYHQWQSSYRHSISSSYRLEIPETQVTHLSRQEFLAQCYESAEDLHRRLNWWLNSEQFRLVKEELLATLSISDSIRFILQADHQLWQLPWHLWDFFDRYPKAEIAFSTGSYKAVEKSSYPQPEVRILAILGNSTAIDVAKDRAMLEQLPDAAVTFLVEPQRQELNHQLWMQPWHILFFAGHSASDANGKTGQISINATESLTVSELKYALRKAIANGLHLAVFNSCDGLGLAHSLADLQIPQMIVMREPVPDLVAQEFLKHFLATFAGGLPLYQAVREAREKLQGLEKLFPCATWLPVICQHSAEVPPTWQEFLGFG
ncbi:MAG: CHAT domain-containing protein [Symploca sp. SIO2C1]|nr:CHAT domain-containing protein [Symploca sp. SIO2C1]